MIIVRANNDGVLALTAHATNDIGKPAFYLLLREHGASAACLCEPGKKPFSAQLVCVRIIFCSLQDFQLVGRREMNLLCGAGTAQNHYKDGESGPAHGQDILHGAQANFEMERTSCADPKPSRLTAQLRGR